MAQDSIQNGDAHVPPASDVVVETNNNVTHGGNAYPSSPTSDRIPDSWTEELALEVTNVRLRLSDENGLNLRLPRGKM